MVFKVLTASCRLLLRLLLELCVDGSADDQPSNLGRSGADLVQLGVAQKPTRRVVVDVAVATENLKR